MRIEGLHHAQITIPKGAEEGAHKFYCDILGLPEIEKPESLQGRGGFWLQVGDRQVHVGTEDGVDRTASKAHLAYQVKDVTAWQAHLQEYGIKVLESVPIPGFARFEARDPFGNRFEMIEPLG
ncbi:glyoxalase [Ktedonobacter sp. SOSP1-52]|uniref:VOC family protein n=1 Tax=Ktedonobacter sp. SOSP1-52 TaxID=2778366 RepID=UPI001916797C|nr:VOC family protein [Ktedonobacter sp. SOSP1-52]GHO65679.1 glyoxalase [Ktedonobacter sp. SOSP1-52]